MRDGTRKRLDGPKVGINTFTEYAELNLHWEPGWFKVLLY